MFLCFSSHSSLSKVSSSSSVLICLIISFSICLVWANYRKSSVSWWLRLVCQKSEALIRVSSSTRAASMQQYCSGLKVNVVFRSLSVFSPDGGISIVYRPLCACLSPNRLRTLLEHREPQGEAVPHTEEPTLCAGESVCAWACSYCAYVLRYFLLNWGLSVNVSLFTDYKEFPSRGEL